MSIAFPMTCFFQPQAIVSLIVADVYFPSRPNLVQPILQDYQPCFGFSDTTRRDCGSFLYGQSMKFLYCLLRRIVSEVHMLAEGDWKSIHDFEFTGRSLFSLGEMIRKIHIRNAALGFLKATVDDERDRSTLKKKRAAQTAATAVDTSLNPFSESAQIVKICVWWYSCLYSLEVWFGQLVGLNNADDVWDCCWDAIPAIAPASLLMGLAESVFCLRGDCPTHGNVLSGEIWLYIYCG